MKTYQIYAFLGTVFLAHSDDTLTEGQTATPTTFVVAFDV